MKTLTGTLVVDRATLRIVFTQLDNKHIGIPNFPNVYTAYSGDFSVADAVDLSNANCTQFKFNATTKAVTEATQDSDTVMMKLALANRKFSIHAELTARITAARRAVHKPIFGQTDIYKMKEAQARNFRKSDYANPAQYPLVHQYAELIGKPPKQAADAILRKARTANAVLAATEHARILYKRSIFAASSFEQLDQVADSVNSLTF